MLVVTRIDRHARSLKDLQDIVHELKAKDVTLKATEQPIDTSTAAGKAFLGMLGVFAEFETNLRRERQLEGIQLAPEQVSADQPISRRPPNRSLARSMGPPAGPTSAIPRRDRLSRDRRQARAGLNWHDRRA